MSRELDLVSRHNQLSQGRRRNQELVRGPALLNRARQRNPASERLTERPLAPILIAPVLIAPVLIATGPIEIVRIGTFLIEIAPIGLTAIAVIGIATIVTGTAIG